MTPFESHITAIIGRDNIMPSSARPTPVAYVVKKQYKDDYEKFQFFYLSLPAKPQQIFHEPFWALFDKATLIGYTDGLQATDDINERVSNALKARQPLEAYDTFKRALNQVISNLPQKPEPKLYRGKSKAEHFMYLTWRMLQKGYDYGFAIGLKTKD